MKEMRAAILERPAGIDSRPLSIVETEAPSPGPGELLIRVRACGVCRTDLHVVEGDLPSRRSPLIPGHQGVGRVESTGAGVERFSRGDRVGVAWLHRTCGTCRFCLGGRENLCLSPDFTGWTVDGGYAGMIVAPASFT